MTIDNTFVLGDVLPPSWTNQVADKLNGIQFGTTTVNTDANGQATITFPHAYASAPVVFSRRINVSAQTAWAAPVTTTDFVVTVRNAADASLVANVTGMAIDWIAVGTLA